MTVEKKLIAAAYNTGAEQEYLRLTENALRDFEFLLLTSLIKKYIPINSTIIDIGSGPGRYAEYLLNNNYKVGLVDLSEISLRKFKDRIDSIKNQNVLFNTVSCATELD